MHWFAGIGIVEPLQNAFSSIWQCVKNTDHERFPQQQPQKEKVWFTFGEFVKPEKINGTKIWQLLSHVYLFV